MNQANRSFVHGSEKRLGNTRLYFKTMLEDWRFKVNNELWKNDTYLFMDLVCEETLGEILCLMHIAIADYEYHQSGRINTKCLNPMKQVPVWFFFSQQLSPNFQSQKLKNVS